MLQIEITLLSLSSDLWKRNCRQPYQRVIDGVKTLLLVSQMGASATLRRGFRVFELAQSECYKIGLTGLGVTSYNTKKEN